MNLTPEIKSRIDAMTYEGLLSMWRNAPHGDKMFQGESGDYFGLRKAELRSAPGGDEMHSRISRSVGW